jgi:PadR family transcriptional regulator, regulatory protein PadR
MVTPYDQMTRKQTGGKSDVPQGTLALMVLKTLESMGPLHGYGIARRIEQTSGDTLALNYGTLYPALLNENNRKARFYRLTRAGRRQLQKEARDWEQATALVARFLAPTEDGA